MGDLIKTTPYSEITATLEALDKYGVTANGLKNIRTMSPILGRQIADIIEKGTGTTQDVSSALDVFYIDMDSKPYFDYPGLLTRKGVLDNEFVFEAMELCKKLKPERKRVIVLREHDFFSSSYPKLGIKDLLSKDLLEVWSCNNLLNGFYISPFTRFDAAIHFAVSLNSIKIPGNEFSVIVNNVRRFISVNRDCKSGSRHTVYHGQPLNERLVFELHKHE